MEAFLVSTGVVALGEIGDKTQLLALVLAARFRKPLPIIAGILVATLANHALAGFLGNLLRTFVPAEVLTLARRAVVLRRRDLGARPDKLDDDEPPPATRWGVFGVTVVAFFLAEMGDKTQVATVVLAARVRRRSSRSCSARRSACCSPTCRWCWSARPRRRRSRSRRCASPRRCCSPRWASTRSSRGVAGRLTGSAAAPAGIIAACVDRPPRCARRRRHRPP